MWNYTVATSEAVICHCCEASELLLQVWSLCWALAASERWSFISIFLSLLQCLPVSHLFPWLSWPPYITSFSLHYHFQVHGFTPTLFIFLCSKCPLQISQLSNSLSRRLVPSQTLCWTLCWRDPRMTKFGLSWTPRNAIIHMKHSTDDLMQCLQRTVVILMDTCTISARVNLALTLWCHTSQKSTGRQAFHWISWRLNSNVSSQSWNFFSMYRVGLFVWLPVCINQLLDDQMYPDPYAHWILLWSSRIQPILQHPNFPSNAKLFKTFILAKHSFFSQQKKSASLLHQHLIRQHFIQVLTCMHPTLLIKYWLHKTSALSPQSLVTVMLRMLMVNLHNICLHAWSIFFFFLKICSIIYSQKTVCHIILIAGKQ